MSPRQLSPYLQWDELEALVVSYPVWPGDTISSRTMQHLADLGLAVRNFDGYWIPTGAGILRHGAGPLPGDNCPHTL